MNRKIASVTPNGSVVLTPAAWSGLVIFVAAQVIKTACIAYLVFAR